MSERMKIDGIGIIERERDRSGCWYYRVLGEACPQEGMSQSGMEAAFHLASSNAALLAENERLKRVEAAARELVTEPDCLSYPKSDAYGLRDPLDVRAPLWTEGGLYGRCGKEAARTLLARKRELDAALAAKGTG